MYEFICQFQRRRVGMNTDVLHVIGMVVDRAKSYTLLAQKLFGHPRDIISSFSIGKMPLFHAFTTFRYKHILVSPEKS